jgi:hypothetical protein
MPQVKRERRERTDNYHLLKQWCRTPEQRLFEGIGPQPLIDLLLRPERLLLDLLPVMGAFSAFATATGHNAHLTSPNSMGYC